MAAVDLIHQNVEQYLAAHPEYRGQIHHQGEGEYVIDGREVKVGFCRQGFLVVHDGPLRQPFTDYVEKKESTAIYHQSGLKSSTLNNLSKAERISFGDEGNRYSRLDAMKVAKEQAAFREKAAQSISEGQGVPADLQAKYEKAIDVKLGRRAWSKPNSQPVAPSWWPGTSASSPAPPGTCRLPTPNSHVPPLANQPPAPGNIFGQPSLLGAMGARQNRMSYAPALGTAQLGMSGAFPAPALGTAQLGSLGMSAGVKATIAGYPQGPVTPMLAGSRCGA